MNDKKEKCKELIKSTINLLDASCQWDDRAKLRAQTLGLQGEKRRERYEAGKEYCTLQYLQCLYNDLWDEEYFPTSRPTATFSVSDISSIPAYFKTYLTKTWETYDAIHQAANDFVIAGYKPIAEKLYELCSCLFDTIIETRRTIKEGDLAKWEYHHVSRYQVSLKENVHDRFESIDGT